MTLKNTEDSLNGMNVKCRIPKELIPIIDFGKSEGKTVSEIMRDGLRAYAEKRGISLDESKKNLNASAKEAATA